MVCNKPVEKRHLTKDVADVRKASRQIIRQLRFFIGKIECRDGSAM
jgi:hypothetical protein